MRFATILTGLLLAIAAVALVRAQTARPDDALRPAQTAKNFGVTPEQLRRIAREELGEPVVIDDDLVVGVLRDEAGRVRTVKITTPRRIIEFNRDAGDQKPGLRYTGGEIAPDAAFASAMDLDGDARVDQILMLAAAGARPTILLRLDSRFEPATAVGGSRFKLDGDGRIVAFDHAARNWAECAQDD